MKTKFGPSGILFVLLAVLALALVPNSGQAAGPGSSTNGDQLQTRDQLRDQIHECTLDVADLDRLRIRDRDRDHDRQHLLTLAPPIEENDGNEYRHRIRENVRHQWYLFPDLMFTLIWPGLF